MDLDQRMTTASAEGIDLDVSLAGIGSRGAALGIDMGVATLLLVVLGWATGGFGDAGAAGFAVIAFTVSVLYPILFEGFGRGRTPGKMAMGLQVTSVEGTPVTFMSAAIRGIVRLVDALPGVFLVGMVSMIATERAQRLGDLAADTVVIHRPSDKARRRQEAALASGLLQMTDPVLSPEVAGWDVSAVTAEEVAMIRSFLQRRSTIDPVRRADLAQTLSLQLLPKVAGVPLDGGPEHFLERVVSAKTSR